MNVEEEDTLRAELIAAFDDSTPDSAPDTPPPDSSIPDSLPDSPAEPSPDTLASSARDEKGRFAGKPAEAVPSKETLADFPPASLSATAKAKWAETPQEIRADIIRREKEVEQGFTKLDEDRQFGKTLKDVVAPYMPIIQAEGGTPVTAIQSLLNSAYILRTASPQKKGELLTQLAKEFGAELPSNTSTVQPDSEISSLKNQIWELQQKIEQQPQVFKQQQETSSLKRDIDAFAADPKNTHFEKLKLVMASLLDNGQASGLQDAYDKAKWADPEIRPLLLEEQRKASEAERIAGIKAKSDAARKAGASVTGSPGAGSGLNGTKSNGSLRDDLMAAFDEHAA